MRLGWAAKIATSRVSSTSSMTYANMSCFHWVCGETIAVLYSQISPCTLVHPIHTRSWGPQHHTHCSSVHVVRLSRNLATHVIVCSMIVLHVVWKMTQWIIYNYMKILLYSVYILYIYIYMYLSSIWVTRDVYRCQSRSGLLASGFDHSGHDEIIWWDVAKPWTATVLYEYLSYIYIYMKGIYLTCTA